VQTSKRPSARAGPWLQPISFGHAGDGPRKPCFLAEMRHQLQRVAVEDHRLFAVIADVRRHHNPVRSRGRVSSPRSLVIWLAIGNCTEPAILVMEAVDQFDGLPPFPRHRYWLPGTPSAARARCRIAAAVSPFVSGAHDDPRHSRSSGQNMSVLT